MYGEVWGGGIWVLVASPILQQCCDFFPLGINLQFSNFEGSEQQQHHQQQQQQLCGENYGDWRSVTST